MTTKSAIPVLARIGLVLALAAAGAARAQEGAKPIDAGTSDVGPLATSLRLAPIDMRVSDGFENVYSVTDENGRERFYRRDGAIIAVFPRSDYILTGYGPLAAIPAGTWFLIGDPTGAQARQFGFADPGDDAGQSDLAVRQRIDTSAASRPSGGSASAPASGAGSRVASDQRPRVEETGDDRSARDGESHMPWASDRDRARRVSRLLAAASTTDE